MPSRKSKPALRSADLLRGLDYEERAELAGQLGVSPPSGLNDKSFEEEVSRFSITTVLGVIVRLRRPFLLMLQDVYQFLSEMGATGRTTTRAVVLPGEHKDIRLVFDSHLREVTATALAPGSTSGTTAALATRVSHFTQSFLTRIEGAQPSFVTAETEVSRVLEMSDDPIDHVLARNFVEHRDVWNPDDLEDVRALSKELGEIYDLIARLLDALGARGTLANWIFEKPVTEYRDGMSAVDSKLRQMEDNQPGSYDYHDPDRSIDPVEWERLREEARLLKEEILAACEFQDRSESLADFLNLDVWRERWRIYELWTLTHLIRLLGGVGFTPDITARVKKGVWDLKYTKDRLPVAFLKNERGELEIYYQLYATGARGGDMPDIAVKRDGRFLLVLDPKDGRSYGEKGLRELALRYRNAFSAALTVIHNYYPMSYEYEEVGVSPRALVVSDVSPGTETLAKLDGEILDLLPQERLPDQEHYVFLIDVSSSTHGVRDRLAGAAERALREHVRRADPGSALILYSDRVEGKVLLHDAAEIKRIVEAAHGGGTDLDAVMAEVLDKLSGVRLLKNLLLFTDDEPARDPASIGERIRTLGVRLQVFQAVGSDSEESLRELARACGGGYNRI